MDTEMQRHTGGGDKTMSRGPRAAPQPHYYYLKSPKTTATELASSLGTELEALSAKRQEQLEKMAAQTGHPIACVALVENAEGKCFRGIALTSNSDVWDRKEGRKRSSHRCFRALYTGVNADPIGMPLGVREVPRNVVEFLGYFAGDERKGGDAFCHFKQAADCKPTPHEQSILDHSRARREAEPKERVG